jgi:hypothetical protein
MMRGRPVNTCRSVRLAVLAHTRISKSRSPGTGISISRIRRTTGEP